MKNVCWKNELHSFQSDIGALRQDSEKECDHHFHTQHKIIFFVALESFENLFSWHEVDACNIDCYLSAIKPYYGQFRMSKLS